MLEDGEELRELLLDVLDDPEEDPLEEVVAVPLEVVVAGRLVELLDAALEDPEKLLELGVTVTVEVPDELPDDDERDETVLEVLGVTVTVTALLVLDLEDELDGLAVTVTVPVPEVVLDLEDELAVPVPEDVLDLEDELDGLAVTVTVPVPDDVLDLEVELDGLAVTVTVPVRDDVLDLLEVTVTVLRRWSVSQIIKARCETRWPTYLVLDVACRRSNPSSTSARC